MAAKSANGPARKEPADQIFDRALDVVGLPPRDPGTAIGDYATSKDFGPNAQAYLKRAAESAELLDQVGATGAAKSARDHYDNVAAPDTKPLKP